MLVLVLRARARAACSKSVSGRRRPGRGGYNHLTRPPIESKQPLLPPTVQTATRGVVRPRIPLRRLAWARCASWALWRMECPGAVLEVAVATFRASSRRLLAQASFCPYRGSCLIPSRLRIPSKLSLPALVHPISFGDPGRADDLA